MSHGYFDDEYDPLAPPRYDDVADDARSGVFSGVWGAGDDAGFGDADRGIGDGTGLARVWFDEGWLPRKVRLNTTWGARIRSGRDLADAFER
ncbi:hypothetical protein, partial [Tessaracoccus sp. OH4464_COT-324]|uniref:hypothetical protein n=1 Tax=Tessaracoccus sp. OH4464_COT-324 TaxID=2491059 RepID=UPI000FB18CEE